MTSHQIFNIKCPKCQKERTIPYRQWWAINKGITSRVCFKCSRLKKGETNGGSFCKGHVPWIKGVFETFISKKTWWGSTGYHHTKEAREKIGQTHRGEKSWRWIKDRTKLVKRQKRNDVAYKEWRRMVWVRDKYKCQLANSECSGKIEAHHILGWSNHPELRYQINNGITLCHAHHPRVRAEEKRLINIFQKLVSVSKANIE